MLKSSLLSVFGTLLGVLFVLVFLYTIFATTYLETIKNRLNIGSIPVSTHSSKYFARYKSSDAGLIIGGQSMAGSVIPLERCFENPRFGRSRSTSSTSDDIDFPVELSKIEATIETLTSPFKDDAQLVEKISEKNELTDLSPSDR